MQVIIKKYYFVSSRTHRNAILYECESLSLIFWTFILQQSHRGNVLWAQTYSPIFYGSYLMNITNFLNI